MESAEQRRLRTKVAWAGAKFALAWAGAKFALAWAGAKFTILSSLYECQYTTIGT